MSDILRLPAEELYKAELEALIKNEKDPVPTGWKMSPRSVLTYIMGGKSGNTVITPKYMGDRRIVEICIATLVTDRALRGRGYAGMLVAQLCAQLLARGAEPMLYADAANPSSCRAYEKIGFTCVGTVTEYRAAP